MHKYCYKEQGTVRGRRAGIAIPLVVEQTFVREEEQRKTWTSASRIAVLLITAGGEHHERGNREEDEGWR